MTRFPAAPAMLRSDVDLLDRSTRKRKCTSSGTTAWISAKSGKKYVKASTNNSLAGSAGASRVSNANSIASSKKRSARPCESNGVSVTVTFFARERVLPLNRGPRDSVWLTGWGYGIHGCVSRKRKFSEDAYPGEGENKKKKKRRGEKKTLLHTPPLPHSFLMTIRLDNFDVFENCFYFSIILSGNSLIQLTAVRRYLSV